MGMSLLAHLAQGLESRHLGRDFRHSFLSILVISVLVILRGAANFEDVAEFGQRKQIVLTRHLALPHEISSADTLWRVFQHLDTKVSHAHNCRFTAT